MIDLFPGLDPQFVNHYLAAFRVRGVAAGAPLPAGPARIFSTAEAMPTRRARASRSVSVALWTGEAAAHRIVLAVLAEAETAGRRAGPTVVRASVAEAEALIREEARKLSIPLTEHSVMIARVAKAKARIDTTIEEMRRTGKLSDLNARFRQSRLEGSGPALTYRKLINDLGQRLVSEMARKFLTSQGFPPVA